MVNNLPPYLHLLNCLSVMMVQLCVTALTISDDDDDDDLNLKQARFDA